MNTQLPVEEPIGHSLHFPKSESRAKERCTSLLLFQTIWITKYFKVIMEFLPDDTKNKLPTPALKEWRKL